MNNEKNKYQHQSNNNNNDDSDDPVNELPENLPYGLTPEDIEREKTHVDQTKLQKYEKEGFSRKSQFASYRQEKERKKREEEEAAQRAIQEAIASFGEEEEEKKYSQSKKSSKSSIGDGLSSMFVKGGVLQPSTIMSSKSSEETKSENQTEEYEKDLKTHNHHHHRHHHQHHRRKDSSSADEFDDYDDYYSDDKNRRERRKRSRRRKTRSRSRSRSRSSSRSPSPKRRRRRHSSRRESYRSYRDENDQDIDDNYYHSSSSSSISPSKQFQSKHKHNYTLENNNNNNNSSILKDNDFKTQRQELFTEKEKESTKSEEEEEEDDDDPYGSTNLFVGNLPLNIAEEVLVRVFGKFGAIGSVKVMWPRTEEEHQRLSHSGFVLFMKRRDAKKAVHRMDGFRLFGNALRVSWGKSIAQPSVPLYDPKKENSKNNNTLNDNENNETNKNNTPKINKDTADGIAVIEVQIPSDPRLQQIIDTTAQCVAKQGYALEKEITRRTQNNPSFDFLRSSPSPSVRSHETKTSTDEYSLNHSSNTHSNLHRYYRWRVFSLQQGDTLDQWRVRPFQMFRGGPLWFPPPCRGDHYNIYGDRRTSSLSSSSASDDRNAADGDERYGNTDKGDTWHSYHRRRPPQGRTINTLSESDEDELKRRLDEISVDRMSIMQTMGWILEHGDAAKQIVEYVTESLMLSDTPISLKVARLYLLSDIVANSNADARNAHAFRKYFESHLPTIFTSIHYCFSHASSRLAGEAMKDRVLRVLNAWQAWGTFPGGLISELKSILLSY